MVKKNKIKIFKPKDKNSSSNIFVKDGISAGFPSPASDFEESRISLEKVLVKNEEATFYARVSGESMKDAGLNDGDILVVDRSEEVKNNKIAVCYLNGEFTVKRVKIEKDHVYQGVDGGIDSQGQLILDNNGMSKKVISGHILEWNK